MHEMINVLVAHKDVVFRKLMIDKVSSKRIKVLIEQPEILNIHLKLLGRKQKGLQLPDVILLQYKTTVSTRCNHELMCLASLFPQIPIIAILLHEQRRVINSFGLLKINLNVIFKDRLREFNSLQSRIISIHEENQKNILNGVPVEPCRLHFPA